MRHSISMQANCKAALRRPDTCGYAAIGYKAFEVFTPEVCAVQACPPQSFPFYGLPPSTLAQLSLQQLNSQGLQAAQTPLVQQYAGLTGAAAAQVAQPQLSKLHQHTLKSRLHSYGKVQHTERTGTSGDPTMVTAGGAERRIDGSDGNRCGVLVTCSIFFLIKYYISFESASSGNPLSDDEMLLY